MHNTANSVAGLAFKLATCSYSCYNAPRVLHSSASLCHFTMIVIIIWNLEINFVKMHSHTHTCIPIIIYIHMYICTHCITTCRSPVSNPSPLFTYAYTLTHTDHYSFDTCSLEYEGCTVEFFFSTNEADPVLIANSEDYTCLNTILPWIIAGSAVGAILLFGLLALVILKLCLMILVNCTHACSYYLRVAIIICRYINFSAIQSTLCVY